MSEPSETSAMSDRPAITDRPDGPSTGPVRAVLVAIQLPDADDDAFAASIAELGRLGRTLGVEIVGTLTQRRRTLDPGTVVGSGKLDELKAMDCRRGAGRPRHHAVAGAQPRDGDRRRGDGPHRGHPGILPPPRALAGRQGAGRYRPAAVPGAAPARAGQGAGPPARRHRRQGRGRIQPGAGPAQDPRPHRRADRAISRRLRQSGRRSVRAAATCAGSRWSATPTRASRR